VNQGQGKKLKAGLSLGVKAAAARNSLVQEEKAPPDIRNEIKT
jgi:hypothetical protein